ncbi:MAG TPA: hypothetical protein VGO60_17780 [Iamia sp.]|nr:hypothetical protein [Iamia sp.]
MRHHHRNRSVLAGLVIAVALLLGVGAPAAGQATTSDPYGSTIPPTEPPGDPTCTVDATQIEVGGTVTGSIAGVAAGSEITLTLGGGEVATVVADGNGEGTFSFTVPEIGGIEALVAVGVTFNVDCGELDPGEVLGETEERPGGVTPGGGSDVQGGGPSRDGGSGSGSGSGGLARTGATLLPLVVIALLLLLVGAAVRRRSRQGVLGGV